MWCSRRLFCFGSFGGASEMNVVSALEETL